jgi:hypothetical protein
VSSLTTALLAAGCQQGGGPHESATSTPSREIPDGVYRVAHSVDDLMAAGLTGAVAHQYAGVLTFELHDGRYSDKQQPGTYEPCEGTYTSTAKTVEIRFVTNCSGTFRATWTLRGDQLTLAPTTPKRDDAISFVIFGAKPFRKIG